MSRVLLALIRRLTPELEREWVVGDTLEEFRHRQQIRGRMPARWWLFQECLRVLAAAPAHRRAVRTGAGDPRTSRLRRCSEALAQDARYFVRRSFQARAFTLTAVAVIALGIAANVAVFSVADAVLFRAAAFPNPDRVVAFETQSPAGLDLGASPVMYEHWRAQTSVVEDVTAFRNVVVNETSGATPDQLRGALVSASYFRLFGANVARGRTFTEEEDRPGGAQVAVISHHTWTRAFGGTDIAGRALRLNGVAYVVIGVLDPAFRMDDIGSEPDVWLPLQLDAGSKTQGHFLWVCGRLRDGVTLAQARARLAVSANQFRTGFPDSLGDTATFTAQPVREAVVRNARPLFLALLGAVGFVLLIACSNIAALLSLQGAVRAREMAVRAALGAGRWRIARQLLTESLLLSVLGGAVGFALGVLSMRLLPIIGISGEPRLDDLASAGPNWRLIAFTGAVSIVTAIVAGVAPAVRGSRGDLNAAMTSADGRSTQGPRRRRTESGLVALQVALAVVLLVGCGLFMRTVSALTRVNPGFNPDHVVTMRVSLAGAPSATTTATDAVVRRGVEALRAVPDVTTAAAAYGLPLQGGGGLPYEIVGRPLPPGQRFHGGGSWLTVSAGYFGALQISIERGREFTEADRGATVPVAIINDVMARREWPHQNPVGQRLVLGHGIGPQFQDEPVREIVGVVASIRDNSLDAPPGAEVYEPIAQLPDVANRFLAVGGQMAWIARTRSAPRGVAPALQDALRQAAGLPVSNVLPLDEIVARSLFRQRFVMWLMAAFGGAALLLASIGLYGLMAYAVEQRVREIGIRLALGAESSRIARTVVWQGLRLTLVGTIAGLLAALVAARAIARLLFGVASSDPLTLGAVVVVVGSVAALAVWLPARRASRVDPIVALRCE
jgi:putative ABC transport system permease protein